jgi:hypothetical protein
MNTYFDLMGFLHASPTDKYSKPEINSILFSIEHALLDNKSRISEINDLIKSLDNRDGTFKMQPHKDILASHDNLTAICSYSYLNWLFYHKEISIWKSVRHPRDFIYLAALKYPALQMFLVPLLTPFLIVTCLTKYKVSYYCNETNVNVGGLENLILDKIKTWFKFTYRKDVMIKTDLELLAWIRFKCLYMPVTKKICYWLLKRRFGDNPYKQVFATYFKRLDHPIRLIVDYKKELV